MAQMQLPPIPETTVREGSRWRHHRPSSEEVTAWFSSQPLDEGMPHDHYVGGVVLIPQSEKAKHRLPDGNRAERFEDTWTPYMQVGTRITYLRRLAEYRELVHVIEPVEVPRVTNPASAYFNGNMEAGYWWHVTRGEHDSVRYLCYTARVALYEPTSYGRLIRGEKAWPVLEGRSTKQVAGGADLNQLGKAQTGAIGRALGVAGILTLGTGVASAEDMLELVGATGSAPVAAEAELPTDATSAIPVADVDEELRLLRARVVEMQAMLQTETPHGWTAFVAWWNERAKEEHWAHLSDVPLAQLKGVVARMERCHAEALTTPPPDAQAAGGESPPAPNGETQVER